MIFQRKSALCVVSQCHNPSLMQFMLFGIHDETLNPLLGGAVRVYPLNGDEFRLHLGTKPILYFCSGILLHHLFDLSEMAPRVFCIKSLCCPLGRNWLQSTSTSVPELCRTDQNRQVFPNFFRLALFNHRKLAHAHPPNPQQ